MKKTLLNILFFISILAGMSTAQPVTFSKVYSKEFQSTIGHSIIQDHDGAFLIAGQHDTGAMLMKIDSAGNLLWAKEISSTLSAIFNVIIPTSDQGYFLAGSATDSVVNDNLYLVKLNASYDTLWSRIIDVGSYYTQIIYAATETYDHGFAVTGSLSKSGAPFTQTLAARLDSSGNLIWCNIFTAGSQENSGYSILQNPDSSYMLWGHMELTGIFENDAVLMKLDSGGGLIWSKKYNTTPQQNFIGTDLVPRPGGFAAFCHTSGMQLGVILLDTAGNAVGGSTTPGNILNLIRCIMPKMHSTSDGGYVYVTGVDDVWGTSTELIKIDSAGTLIWSQNVDQNTIEAFETRDSGYILLGNGPLAGMSPHSIPQDPHMGIVKTDAYGMGVACTMPDGNSSLAEGYISINIQPTFTQSGVLKVVSPLITLISLDADSGCVLRIGSVSENELETVSVFPNPSDGNFTITGIHSERELQILNVLGECVYGITLTGNTEQKISTRLQRGIYLLQICSDEGKKIQKLIVN